MAEQEVEVLRKARESFVRKRRAMAEQMAPAGAASAHFAPAFADLQAAIEAIDRAIKDEEQLPPNYAGFTHKGLRSYSWGGYGDVRFPRCPA